MKFSTKQALTNLSSNKSERNYFFIKFVTFTGDQLNFIEFPQKFFRIQAVDYSEFATLEGIFHIIIMVKINVAILTINSNPRNQCLKL